MKVQKQFEVFELWTTQSEAKFLCLQNYDPEINDGTSYQLINLFAVNHAYSQCFCILFAKR